LRKNASKKGTPHLTVKIRIVQDYACVSAIVEYVLTLALAYITVYKTYFR